jgi:Protein of unknown function (DUF295)
MKSGIYIITFKENSNRNYLVQSSDELLLVEKKNQHFTDNTPCIMIFRLTDRYVTEDSTVESYEWEMVENVGNMMIFLGDKGSLCVDSSLHPGTKGNCV